ncbi:hypothetical protein Hypma_000848 [Hypsizygus marmoreus]|uniref:Uncharacterized protein n=1 Tax=Hypsizygus marmoreus TaxID=39966 RepID=A0A369J944_HYPMA|nr:hypothetical protein Hypma_000848 [Hypsizygus marmoreus]
MFFMIVIRDFHATGRGRAPDCPIDYRSSFALAFPPATPLHMGCVLDWCCDALPYLASRAGLDFTNVQGRFGGTVSRAPALTIRTSAVFIQRFLRVINVTEVDFHQDREGRWPLCPTFRPREFRDNWHPISRTLTSSAPKQALFIHMRRAGAWYTVHLETGLPRDCLKPRKPEGDASSHGGVGAGRLWRPSSSLLGVSMDLRGLDFLTNQSPSALMILPWASWPMICLVRIPIVFFTISHFLSKDLLEIRTSSAESENDVMPCHKLSSSLRPIYCCDCQEVIYPAASEYRIKSRAQPVRSSRAPSRPFPPIIFKALPRATLNL